jgi:PPOX class probable F420-dependent enzyme
MGQLTMSKDEREAFLAAVRVGVLAVNGESAPSLTPIWYAYEPGGDVVMHTSGTSPKTALMRAAGRASLCVQTETAPYQYVVVEGPVSIAARADGDDLRRDIAHRYLGPELGDMYIDATSSEEEVRNGVFVALTPERWRTVDFNKQFG